MKSKLNRKWFLVLVLAASWSQPSGASTTYDAAADFEAGWLSNSNPNGVWSYGYSSTLGGPVTLYNGHLPGADSPSQQQMLISTNPGVNCCIASPSVGFNNGPAFDDGNVAQAANQIVLVSSVFQNLITNMIFTAPLGGTYSLTSSFVGDQRNIGVGVYVLKNNSVLFSSAVTAFGQVVPFNTNVTLLAGDTVSFAVVQGGGNQNAGVSASLTFLGGSGNLPPTADAGPDQSIHVGTTLQLNGGGSFDDNTPTASLGYAWTVTSRPAGSVATLINANTATPSFAPDRTGNYIVQLIVTDEQGLSSAPDFAILSSLNQAPTAVATVNPNLVIVGHVVQLNGYGSTDPDPGDTLTYAWTITQAPAGSAASLAGANTATATIVPMVAGTYAVTLTVSDLVGPGTPATVTFTATTAQGYAETQLLNAANLVSGLTSSQVTTIGNLTAFNSFLKEAAAAIQKKDTTTAMNKLNDAIQRTNGCEVSGSPDGNGAGRDWITDCAVQSPVLVYLRAALSALTP